MKIFASLEDLWSKDYTEGTQLEPSWIRREGECGDVCDERLAGMRDTVCLCWLIVVPRCFQYQNHWSAEELLNGQRLSFQRPVDRLHEACGFCYGPCRPFLQCDWQPQCLRAWARTSYSYE